MINFGERDPEEVGPEHPEDVELRMRVAESIHEFVPDENGNCSEEGCKLEQWSVLHIDEESDFRERHWHGGGDCMCFEAHEDQY